SGNVVRHGVEPPRTRTTPPRSRSFPQPADGHRIEALAKSHRRLAVVQHDTGTEPLSAGGLQLPNTAEVIGTDRSRRLYFHARHQPALLQHDIHLRAIL